MDIPVPRTPSNLQASTPCFPVTKHHHRSLRPPRDEPHHAFSPLSEGSLPIPLLNICADNESVSGLGFDLTDSREVFEDSGFSEFDDGHLALSDRLVEVTSYSGPVNPSADSPGAPCASLAPSPAPSSSKSTLPTRPACLSFSSSQLCGMSNTSYSDELVFSSPTKPTQHRPLTSPSMPKRVPFASMSPLSWTGNSSVASHLVPEGPRSTFEFAPALETGEPLSSRPSLPAVTALRDKPWKSASDDSVGSYGGSDAWRAVGEMMGYELPSSTRPALDPVHELEATTRKFGVGYRPRQPPESRHPLTMSLQQPVLGVYSNSDGLRVQVDDDLGWQGTPQFQSRSLGISENLEAEVHEMLQYDSSQSADDDGGRSQNSHVQIQLAGREDIHMNDRDGLDGFYGWTPGTVDELLALESVDNLPDRATLDGLSCSNELPMAEGPILHSVDATEDNPFLGRALSPVSTSSEDPLLLRGADSLIEEARSPSPVDPPLARDSGQLREYARAKLGLQEADAPAFEHDPPSLNCLAPIGQSTPLSLAEALRGTEQSVNIALPDERLVSQREKNGLGTGGDALGSVEAGIFEGPSLFGDDWDEEEDCW
ncbi:hypothetical protein OE88DRAFT_1055050 [Heliocybe sulcata]|uniref:Uncharacterized protein n=1 Tax=Heliocybe sulcata TaxID=5364 RepID=A0A5C3MLD5_9AGAM|nr:hypothetical protein OE88DRAFT_1055050 [Heliocybe sulcata]